MTSTFEAHRDRPEEQARIRDLFDLLPARGGSALDIGARDGYLSLRLAERFDRVVALDLQQPHIDHPRITCVAADATHLPFDDASFDAVLCAEVLEHIPPVSLPAICAEIVRVCRGHVVIGVPYRQDIRLWQTTCARCQRRNPPWGHVNSFDEARLQQLFAGLSVERVSFVGSTRDVTSALSVALMDFAGNPYGTYVQDEGCIGCGAALVAPTGVRSVLQRVATRAAVILNRVQQRFTAPRGNWIHIAFTKA